MPTYQLDISDSAAGTYTKVKKIFEATVGVEWTYNKPVFTFQCDDAAAISTALADIGMALTERKKKKKKAAKPAPAPAPAPKAKATYRAYCTQGQLVFSRGGEVGDATGEELLARHASEGVTHVDIFSAAGVETFYA